MTFILLGSDSHLLILVSFPLLASVLPKFGHIQGDINITVTEMYITSDEARRRCGGMNVKHLGQGVSG